MENSLDDQIAQRVKIAQVLRKLDTFTAEERAAVVDTCRIPSNAKRRKEIRDGKLALIWRYEFVHLKPCKKADEISREINHYAGGCWKRNSELLELPLTETSLQILVHGFVRFNLGKGITSRQILNLMNFQIGTRQDRSGRPKSRKLKQKR